MNLPPGNQPVLFVRGRTIPEAWQNAVLALHEQGCDVPTSFDRPGDPPSKDATVIVVVDEPLGEPRIHKRALPAGLDDLEVYRLEVVAGVHDHWVNRFGKEWNYTYHERIRAYDVGDGRKIDQLENMLSAMVQSEFPPQRRFQIITWIPSVDPFIDDPPCLQRLHFRLLPDGCGGWVLNLNTDWRSRDGYKAWFMNVFAMTDLQRLVAKELSERMGARVSVGRYVDKSDSLHIYGKDFTGVGGLEGFLNILRTKPLSELTWTTEFAQPMFVEARRRLAAQLDAERQGHGRAALPPGVDLANYPYPQEWDR